MAVFAAQPAPLHAANECLSGPKGAAPKGSHWYYRVDRATKKNCWYVRAESRQAPVASSSGAKALPQAETALQPAVANARAEADPAIVAQPNMTAPEPAPFAAAGSIAETSSAADTSQSTVASRWLDQPAKETNNTSSPPPAASDASPDSSTPVAAPAAQADMRSSVPSAPFPPLLLVIVGALVAAAGVAGAIYRFGRARRNEPENFDRQPHAPWDVMDIGATIRSPPLASEAASPPSDPARGRPEAAIPDEIVQLLSTLSKEAPA